MRNLGLIISFWLSAFLVPTNSLALGLGGIEVNSFLNQPLKAEIEVISARAGEIDDLLVGLASRDAFTRAGLSRPNNLSELRFTVQKSEEGDSAVILVTTKAAIKEPFLNFLVEADWSKGRLLREFTILLDPPFYADSPAPAPQPEPEPVQPVAEIAEVMPEPEPEAPVPIVESEPVESTSTSEQPTITEPIAFSEDDQDSQAETAQVDYSASEVVTTGDVAVAKGDTLWSIASGLRNTGYGMSQIMLAIQRANPEAFGDNNINNLKVGSVLRMPDASEIGEIDQQQAYAEVLEQNGLWDDYVARVTGQPAVATEGDAEVTTEDGVTVDSDTTEQTAELNLVTPGDGESDAAGLQNEGEDANELRVKLALAEEELEASRIENAELDSRIGELEARLSKFEELQKMVQIEDDSLAKIQENQAQENEAEVISDEQRAADEEALLEELLTEEGGSEAGAEESSDAMTEDSMAADTSVETEVAVVEESDALSDDSLENQQPETAPPIPVIVTEPVQDEPSFLDGILPDGIVDMLPDVSGIMPSSDSLALDPIMLGGLGGILLLLIGLVIYKRRKSSGDDEAIVNDPIFAVDGGVDDEELTPIHLAEGIFEGLDEDISDTGAMEDSPLPVDMLEDIEDDSEEALDDFSQTTTSIEEMPAPEESAAAPVVEEQDDILNEADVYLAYNLYDNAEELLTSSLEDNPERADYRAKLLDTHFATKNVDAFVREAETLRSMGTPADRYWGRVMVMGFELAPDNALFAEAKDSGISAADLEFSKPAAADFDLGAEEDDTNFSTTDFDLGEEDTNTFESSNFSVGGIDSDAEMPQFDESLDSADMPDEIGDLDFAFEGDEAGIADVLTDSAEDEDEDLDFGLPDDLDLGSDDLDSDSTAVLEAGTAVIDVEDAFASALEDDDDDEPIESTDVIELAEIPNAGDVNDEIDFGMEDTAMIDSVDEGIDDVMLNLDDVDDDSLSVNVDMSADNSKTDTFAPGDFDDPEELSAIEADISSAGFDDIEDLMLPDDIDEVSTKLDLARAFIDMGDAEGARSSLDEVMVEGNDEQKAEARDLIDQL